MEHKKVHAPVSGPFAILTPPCPQGMVIFFEPLLLRFPLVGLYRLFLEIDAFIYIHPKTFRSLNTETKGIGPRQVGIVLEQDGLPIGTGKGCGDHIAQLKTDMCVRMLWSAFFYNMIVKSPGFGRERTQL